MPRQSGLATRVLELRAELAANDKQLLEIVTAHAPVLLEQVGIGGFNAAIILSVWSHPGRIHGEAALARIGGVAPIEVPRATATNTDSAAAATANSTARSTRSPEPAHATTPRPSPTSNAAPNKASATAGSADASSATSPARPTEPSEPCPHPPPCREPFETA